MCMNICMCVYIHLCIVAAVAALTIRGGRGPAEMKRRSGWKSWRRGISFSRIRARNLPPTCVMIQATHPCSPCFISQNEKSTPP